MTRKEPPFTNNTRYERHAHDLGASITCQQKWNVLAQMALVCADSHEKTGNSVVLLNSAAGLNSSLKRLSDDGARPSILSLAGPGKNALRIGYESAYSCNCPAGSIIWGASTVHLCNLPVW